MSNLLPLESWRRIMGFNPFAFWGLANADQVPILSTCNNIVTKYNWQNTDAVGREAIIEAIEEAESRLLAELGFAVAPHFAEATITYPRFNDPPLNRVWPVDPTGRWLSVTLPEKKIIALGIEKLDSLQTNVSLTFSDPDGDGLDDAWTLTTTATTTETNPDYLAVYFNAADRLNGDGPTDEWRILPVKVVINDNGTVSVSGKSWQIVRPILYEGVGTNWVFPPIDPAVLANFAASLDVYHRRPWGEGTGLDTCQAEFVWETRPYVSWAICCGCDGSPSLFDAATDPASYWAAVGRCGFRNALEGTVIPGVAVYDAASGVWQSAAWGLCRQPDRVTVRYYAGEQLQNQQMKQNYQVAVARLAAAEMANKIASCDAANRELFRWQFDLARAAGANDEQYRIGDDELSNPLGTRAGHVYAWKVIRELRVLGGVGV